MRPAVVPSAIKAAPPRVSSSKIVAAPTTIENQKRTKAIAEPSRVRVKKVENAVNDNSGMTVSREKSVRKVVVIGNLQSMSEMQSERKTNADAISKYFSWADLSLVLALTHGQPMQRGSDELTLPSFHPETPSRLHYHSKTRNRANPSTHAQSRSATAHSLILDWFDLF